MSMRETVSTTNIRTAIRELSARAELARKEGRHGDADELDTRIQRYREALKVASGDTLRQRPSSSCTSG